MMNHKIPFYTSAELSSALGQQRNSVPLDAPCASEIKISHIKDRISEVMRRGAMIMEPKIEIHNDYCKKRDSAEIEAVLSQITALITNAVLRAVSQLENAA